MQKINSPEGQRIITLLQVAQGETRFVGGCVRNALLEIPAKDIDLATTLPPEKVMEVLNNEGIRAIPTGIAFGTVTAIVNDVPVEITTLRNDEWCDGRHADVRYTTNWKEDAARRDFTVNAMSMDDAGNLYDFFGGKTDSEQRIIRFVGSPLLRIQEDYLRILRLFRFHAYYGRGEILPEQLQACQASVGGLSRLSAERVQAEMIKILAASDPTYVLEAMRDCGVLNAMLPQLYDDYISTDGVKSLLEIPFHSSALVRFAALLMMNDVDEDIVSDIADRWRLSKDDRKHLLQVMFPICVVNSNLNEAGIKRAIRKLGKPIFRDVALLAWAMEGQEMSASYQFMLEFASQWVIPKLPIRGVDILRLGVNEGREVGRLLEIAEDYWEEGNYQVSRAVLLDVVIQQSSVEI